MISCLTFARPICPVSVLLSQVKTEYHCRMKLDPSTTEPAWPPGMMLDKQTPSEFYNHHSQSDGVAKGGSRFRAWPLQDMRWHDHAHTLTVEDYLHPHTV